MLQVCLEVYNFVQKLARQLVRQRLTMDSFQLFANRETPVLLMKLHYCQKPFTRITKTESISSSRMHIFIPSQLPSYERYAGNLLSR